MSSLGFWSMVIISYQTVFSVTMSWLILDCMCAPEMQELHEVTMMKFLYLYDPKACGRVYFYNITNVSEDRLYGNVVWPLKNKIASSFRTKVQLWLSLHLIWLLFAIINVTQGERSCSFYATLMPFTFIGVTLLIVDVVYACIFIVDSQYTGSEAAIIGYVSQLGHLRAMNERPLSPRRKTPTDTSWISMLLVFISLRGIVQWIVNFWIVKDNYFEGLKRYRHRLVVKPKEKPRRNSRTIERNEA